MKVFVKNLGEVTSLLAAGKGVDLSTKGVDGLCDRFG